MTVNFYQVIYQFVPMETLNSSWSLSSEQMKAKLISFEAPPAYTPAAIHLVANGEATLAGNRGWMNRGSAPSREKGSYDYGNTSDSLWQGGEKTAIPDGLRRSAGGSGGGKDEKGVGSANGKGDGDDGNGGDEHPLQAIPNQGRASQRPQHESTNVSGVPKPNSLTKQHFHMAVTTPSTCGR